MSDQLIDPMQVELLEIEGRYNPENADARSIELITLYKFQQKLINQWHDEAWSSRSCSLPNTTTRR